MPLFVGASESYDTDAWEAYNLKKENAKLREQSERLRTQLADVTKSVGRVEERCAKTFEVGKRWMAKAARFEAENAKLRELVRWAARILTGIFPYVDYSRCTALEAVAAWKAEASKLGIEVDE